MADEHNEAAVDETETTSDDPVADGAEAEATDEAAGETGTDEAPADEAGDTAAASGAEDKAEDKDKDKDKAEDEDEAPPVSEAKKRADAIIAQRQVTRRTITSKRVTPKAGTKPSDAAPVTSKARNARVTEQIQARYTPPEQTYAKGPSPWWVPAIMFGLLIIGALIIMLNYMGAFGEAENIRLVIGLAFILGGIITATQYR